MKSIRIAAIGVLAGAAMAVASGPAMAAVVCNAAGDCWHADHPKYPSGLRFETHPDDWYFHQRWDNDNRRHWREHHEGRGYYQDGVWVPR